MSSKATRRLSPLKPSGSWICPNQAPELNPTTQPQKHPARVLSPAGINLPKSTPCTNTVYCPQTVY